MRKLLLVVICCLAIMGLSFELHADNQPITFEWDQVITEGFSGWRLWVGETTGGPYDKGLTYFRNANGDPVESIWIAYDGSQGGTFQSTQTMVVESTVTLYFVLNAWNDAGEYSGNSNEAFNEFIVSVPPSGPFNFKVVVPVQ